MAQQNRNTLKQYFETGKKPTQQEYEDLIDSFLNRDEDDFVESLENATTSNAGIVRRSTSAEAESGVDINAYVTPLGTKKAIENFAPSLAPVQSVNGYTGIVNIDILNEDTGWIDATLLNNIVEFNTAEKPRYRKKNGVVYFKGRVKGGPATNSSTVLFNLPAQFRPLTVTVILIGTAAGGARVEIQTNGNVNCVSYHNQWTSISGVCYLID